jgi:hypothetical protein
MDAYVKKAVEEKIAKLRSDNEVLVRQIPFLVQRAEDMKGLLFENMNEMLELHNFLQEPIVPEEPEEKDNGLPQHTNIIVG